MTNYFGSTADGSSWGIFGTGGGAILGLLENPGQYKSGILGILWGNSVPNTAAVSGYNEYSSSFGALSYIDESTNEHAVYGSMSGADYNSSILGRATFGYTNQAIYGVSSYGVYNYGIIGIAEMGNEENGEVRNYGVYGTASEGLTRNWGMIGISYGTKGNEFNYGVAGQAQCTADGTNLGVLGYATGSNIANYGAYLYAGEGLGSNYGFISSTDDNGNGMENYGGNINVTGGTGNSYGIQAEVYGTGYCFGVNGNAYGTGLNNYAVRGYASGATYNQGVRGYASGTATTNYGVYGYAAGATNNYAGYFSGNVHVNGTLSKSAGSFKIDHPLDPDNKYLIHSFVESPDMMNIYNGNIKTDENGIAVVELPEYFDVLNIDFKYQLTVIGQFAQAIVKDKISGNSFTIQTDLPNVEVSWQVTGVRNDEYAKRNRIEPETMKNESEIGKYLYPEYFGKSKDFAIDAESDDSMSKKTTNRAIPNSPAISPDDYKNRSVTKKTGISENSSIKNNTKENSK